MYDTLYRYLVLFGIPEKRFKQKTSPLVWEAISDCLVSDSSIRARRNTDVNEYNSHCKKFAIRGGNNRYISRARKLLNRVGGGLDLLLGLCCFEPQTA